MHRDPITRRWALGRSTLREQATSDILLLAIIVKDASRKRCAHLAKNVKMSHLRFFWLVQNTRRTFSLQNALRKKQVRLILCRHNGAHVYHEEMFYIVVKKCPV